MAILPSSASSARSLVYSLNQNSTTWDIRRVHQVTQLIEDIHEADRIAARTSYSIDAKPKMLPGERRYRLKELLDRIEIVGSKARVSVHLFYPSKNGWHSGWKYWGPGNRRVRDIQLLFDIQRVCDLASAGLIRRVRRCQLCSLWYVARRNHQEFCTARCRERSFRSSKQGRTARAAYMRRYRAGLRRRDRENLKIR